MTVKKKIEDALVKIKKKIPSGSIRKEKNAVVKKHILKGRLKHA